MRFVAFVLCIWMATMPASCLVILYYYYFFPIPPLAIFGFFNILAGFFPKPAIFLFFGIIAATYNHSGFSMIPRQIHFCISQMFPPIPCPIDKKDIKHKQEI